MLQQKIYFSFKCTERGKGRGGERQGEREGNGGRETEREKRDRGGDGKGRRRRERKERGRERKGEREGERDRESGGKEWREREAGREGDWRAEKREINICPGNSLLGRIIIHPRTERKKNKSTTDVPHIIFPISSLKISFVF